jgi:hypothetical protein
MANTTNYNWETPDDTDLVKDGAAAIRTLGSSIDTTTKALNPSTTLGDIEYRSSTANTNARLAIGTNGQILGVSSGVPAWINNDQGDITEVAAGTGISVASGTGPIPTVSINTAVTADLTTAQTLTNKTLTSPKISLAYTAKTDNYTIADGDQNALFTMNAATAKTFSIPTDATFNFAIGTQVHFAWITGAGQPSIAAVTSGTTTILSTGATSTAPKLRVANSAATAIKLAANSWLVVGDIA